MPPALRFTLYSRPGCGLCEEMIEELAALPQAQGVPLEVADVDRNALIQARYGHKVPVLLLNGELICHGRLDSEELHKALTALR